MVLQMSPSNSFLFSTFVKTNGPHSTSGTCLKAYQCIHLSSTTRTSSFSSINSAQPYGMQTLTSTTWPKSCGKLTQTSQFPIPRTFINYTLHWSSSSWTLFKPSKLNSTLLRRKRYNNSTQRFKNFKPKQVQLLPPRTPIQFQCLQNLQRKQKYLRPIPRLQNLLFKILATPT